MRLFTLCLLVICGYLQYEFWLGKNGVFDNQALENTIVVQQQANQDLALRNQQMFSEIDDLREGEEAIEERARNELGLVKSSETFFRLVTD